MNTRNDEALEFDLFISHASEDKDTIVRPLARALIAAGIRVWYDEAVLQIGDNLRRSIDQGLAKSRFGAVIISKTFLSKKWTQWELDGLIQRHLDSGSVILPIWHEVLDYEVKAYSPSLANIVAARTDEGLATVLAKVLSVVNGKDGPESANSTAKSDPSVVAATSSSSRLAVVSEHFEFDDVCFEFERLMDSDGNDHAIRQLLCENPRLLSFLVPAMPCVIQTRPSMGAAYTFDAFALCIPQWTERTLFKFGSVLNPPFESDGAWSEELVNAIGTTAGWLHKGDQQNFRDLAVRVVNSLRDKWPRRSSYHGFDRLVEAAHYADITSFILLFGRRRMINERFRRLFHDGPRREVIRLRSYDAILEALYSHCPSIDFAEPVVVASLQVHKGEEGSFTVRSEILDEVTEKLLALLGRSPGDDASIRVVDFFLRVRGNLGDIPSSTAGDGSAVGYDPDINRFALGITDNNPNTWRGDNWRGPSSYNSVVTPATWRQGLLVRYAAPGIERSIDLTFVVDSVRYREQGAKLRLYGVNRTQFG